MTSAKKFLGLVGLGCLVLAALPAAAHEGWDCNFEGTDAARYVSRFERHGSFLVEPHWPRALAYRILVETHYAVVAVHSDAAPPGFRRDARTVATVLMINKMSGRSRRAAGASFDDTDRVEFGTCKRL